MSEYLYYVEQWDPDVGPHSSYPVALFEEWDEAVQYASQLRVLYPLYGARAVTRLLPVSRKTEEVA